MNLKSLHEKISRIFSLPAEEASSLDFAAINGKSAIASKESITEEITHREHTTVSWPLSEAEKDRLAAEFRAWLDEEPEGLEKAAEPSEPEQETDLYSLFSELIALKNEVKIESRQFKNAIDQQQKAFTLLESAQQSFKKEREGREQLMDELRSSALKPLLREILEIRDRIEASLAAFKRLQGKMLRKKYRKKISFASFVQGQMLILGRIDKFLQANGVQAIEALNKAFDPELMRAVEVAEDEDREEGSVVGEIRKGFTYRGEVIRVAEVVVNRVTRTANEREKE